MKRDAARDMEYVRVLREFAETGNPKNLMLADALEYWIREAQAQKERAEMAEKEREAVIKLVLDNYSFCPVNVVCLGENGPSCRECLEADIRKRLAQEVGKDG